MSINLKALEKKYSLIKESDKDDVLAGLGELEQLEKTKQVKQAKAREWEGHVNTIIMALTNLNNLTKDRDLIEYYKELQEKIDTEGEDSLSHEEQAFYYLATGVDELLGDEIRGTKIDFL